MNPRGLPLCSFICAIAIAMMPHAAQAGGLTAKSSLPKTLPAAKKWNSDAVLVGHLIIGG